MRTAFHPLSRARGFTMLELAAVLAVTAVIGALGVSAYRTYAVRAEVTTAVTAAAAVQEQVGRAFAATGQPPADRHAAGFIRPLDAPAAALVATLEIVDGRIDLKFGATADEVIAGKTLSLTPFETADQRVVWICGNRVPGVGLQPLGFAGGGRQAIHVITAIDARYLPSTCR